MAGPVLRTACTDPAGANSSCPGCSRTSYTSASQPASHTNHAMRGRQASTPVWPASLRDRMIKVGRGRHPPAPPSSPSPCLPVCLPASCLPVIPAARSPWTHSPANAIMGNLSRSTSNTSGPKDLASSSWYSSSRSSGLLAPTHSQPAMGSTPIAHHVRAQTPFRLGPLSVSPAFLACTAACCPPEHPPVLLPLVHEHPELGQLGVLVHGRAAATHAAEGARAVGRVAALTDRQGADRGNTGGGMISQSVGGREAGRLTGHRLLLSE